MKNTDEVIIGKNRDEQDSFLRANEDTLLAGILKAANLDGQEEPETYPVEVTRKGKTLFSFRIRPLSETENYQCNKQAGVYKRNKRLGGEEIRTDYNPAKYRSLLIYTATVDEDRKRIWDNPRFLRATDCVTGWEMVDKIFHAGEKAAVIDKIEKISGFTDDDGETVTGEELLKN